VNNTRNFTAIAFAAIVLGVTAGCQMGQNQNASGNNTNTSTNAAVKSSTPAASPSESAVEAGTPTAAYEAAYTARKNKDIEGLKKVMSKDVLSFMTMIGSADEKNKKTLDEMLKDLCDEPQAATAEARNEKIDGDKATIEYLDVDGKWNKMDFVKEDGAWKLTIDKADKDELEK